LIFAIIFGIISTSQIRNMKKFILTLILLASLVAQSSKKTPVLAQNFQDIEVDLSIDDILTPSEDGELNEASAAAKLASPSAEIEEKLEEKTTHDITDPNPKDKKSELAAYLDQHPIEKLTLVNPLQIAIRKSIQNGLPANIIVLLLLFPLIAAVIAASRHVIGLKGFGIYIPAVLSVAFVSTKIVTGTIVFVLVLVTSYFSQRIINKFRMQYLPRTAMLLWSVSTIILLFLMLASFIEQFSLLTINIFPILIIILLTENFMNSQLFSNQKRALRLTIETLVIALICAFIISREGIQKFVILRPEITLLSAACMNILLSKYSGLRLLEYLRFDTILKRNK